MTEPTTTRSDLVDQSRFNFSGSAAVALLVGAGLAWPGRSGATPLLIAVAVVQAVLAFAWLLGLDVPGRLGGLVIAALTAAGADVAVSIWPHSRLGPILGVLALAVPVLFVHQLVRGVRRVRVLDSMGAIALLVVAEAALPALLQLRHEFASATLRGDVVFAVVVAGTGALLVGYFTDMVIPAPRFDTDVPRGLLAVLASVVVGAAAAYLGLRNSAQFAGGRGAFIGAALGALIALLAVAVAFIEQDSPLPAGGVGRRARPMLGVVVPLSLLGPVALLLCIAIAA